LDNS